MATTSGNDARRRVLFADDNFEMRAFVRRLLSDDYDVQVVADGLAALDEARAARPDLLITDVVMPRLDGLGLIRAIRGEPALRTLPVIVVSERDQEGARIEGLEAGADDYVTKPFHPGELLARVRSNIDLSRMREQIERAAGREEALRGENRRKDEFLSMLAHELRNPLAPIGYGLHLLAQPDLDPALLTQTRGMLDRQMQHLTRIVDDLLDVSRLTSGKLSIERERIDLGRLVRDAVEDRRGTLEGNGLRLDTRVPATPVWTTADQTRLTQMLDNLIDNARKFTPGGGRVAVQLREDPARRLATITVTDTGVGIASALLPRIFQPFSQAEQTLDRSRGGLGLGLAVARGLAELHGGTIEASSAGAGYGATFTITLQTEAEPTPLAPQKLEGAAIRKGLRVLVVEDNQDSADMLRALLEFKGCDVSVAYTGPEGVEAATSQNPDVVLCDIGLPGMDGYQVAGALRRHPATARVRLIAVTGYGQDSDKRRAMTSGFDSHLVKPVNPNILISQLVAG